MPQPVRYRNSSGHWSSTTQAGVVPTVLLRGERIYGAGAGHVRCLSATSGELLWQGPPRVGENVTFLSLPGHVVALTSNGQLQILAAQGEQHEKVAEYKVSDTPTWAPPVLLKTGFLVKDEKTLTFWAF